MKLILSRKGFDSSSGGCPSPILPDGSLLSLPIPDSRSVICYRDLEYPGVNGGRLVSQLTRGRYRATSRAHLDPDLVASTCPREPGWKAVLGQTGAAQGHLRGQGVGVGDLFLFFGLFRPVEWVKRRWRFVPGSPARHICWGWLQVGDVLPVDQVDLAIHPWLTCHPHLQIAGDANNTLYIAADRLQLGGGAKALPGSGVFPALTDALQLTAPDAQGPSDWRLPPWFYPDQRTPLSYHGNPARWQQGKAYCQLRCASRGQEFVLNMSEYPESVHWLLSIIHNHGGGGSIH